MTTTASKGWMVVTVDNQSILMSKASASGWRRPSARRGDREGGRGGDVSGPGGESPGGSGRWARPPSTRLTSARRRRGERRLRASRRGATTSLRSTRSLRCRRTYALTSGASAIRAWGVAVSASTTRSRGAVVPPPVRDRVRRGHGGVVVRAPRPPRSGRLSRRWCGTWRSLSRRSRACATARSRRWTPASCAWRCAWQTPRASCTRCSRARK